MSTKQRERARRRRREQATSNSPSVSLASLLNIALKHRTEFTATKHRRETAYAAAMQGDFNRFYQYMVREEAFARTKQEGRLQTPPAAMYGQHASVLFTLLRWCESGNLTVYRLSREMCAALAFTDPPDIPYTELQCPYPAQMFELPADWWTTTPLEEEPHYRVVDGRHLTVYSPATKTGLRYSISHCLFGHTDVLATASDGTQGISYSMHAFAGPIVLHNVAIMQDTAAYVGKEEPSESADDTTLRLLRRMCINAVLYVTSGYRCKRASSSPRYRARCHDAKREPTIWWLAEPVELKKQQLDAARELTEPRHRRQHDAERRQHLVRGHWKLQRCGPRGQDRKRIWVAPYWRNLDSDERVSFAVKVDAEAPSSRVLD